MASGYFPRDRKHDEVGEKLVKASELLAEVLDEYYSICASQDQTDNACSDGGSLALLSLAKQLINGELRPIVPIL